MVLSGGLEMAEIVAFNPSAARPRRLTEQHGKPLGEVVFFTGVRYERWQGAPLNKPKPQHAPLKPPRLKSKAKA
jgi:hypothetical protein